MLEVSCSSSSSSASGFGLENPMGEETGEESGLPKWRATSSASLGRVKIRSYICLVLEDMFLRDFRF